MLFLVVLIKMQVTALGRLQQKASKKYGIVSHITVSENWYSSHEAILTFVPTVQKEPRFGPERV